MQLPPWSAVSCVRRGTGFEFRFITELKARRWYCYLYLQHIAATRPDLLRHPHGWVPTLTALATVLVAVLIADRVDALLFATYNMVPSRDMANTQRSTPDTDGLGNGQ